MFFNFRRKPPLSALIPQGYIDMHCHVLPGIDDGAKNLNESLGVLEGMKDLGFEGVIATPHTMGGVWPNTPQTIESSFNQVNTANNKAIHDLRYSSEYLIDDDFINLMEQGQLMPLKDDLLLVELSYFQPPPNLFEVLFELTNKGYQPVLAHPERYRFYFDSTKTFYKLKSVGCLFQLNLMSLVGHYGDDVAAMADKLLKLGLYDFSGSDIHGTRHFEIFNKPVTVKNHKGIPELLEKNQFFKL